MGGLYAKIYTALTLIDVDPLRDGWSWPNKRSIDRSRESREKEREVKKENLEQMATVVHGPGRRVRTRDMPSFINGTKISFVRSAGLLHIIDSNDIAVARERARFLMHPCAAAACRIRDVMPPPLGTKRSHIFNLCTTNL